MPDFGIMRGFGDKLFGNKLVAGQLPTNLGKIGSQSFGFDIDAVAFFNRVIANGGTLSGIEQIATDQLVKDLKSYGIWSLIKGIYPMVGSSAAACSRNLKSDTFNGTFSNGWTFASTGVTPNGINAVMNTGYVQTSFLFGISIYNRTNTNKLGLDIGQLDPVPFAYTHLLLGLGSTSMRGRNSTNANIDYNYNTTNVGFWQTNRISTSTNGWNVNYNGLVVGLNSSFNNTLPTSSVVIGGDGGLYSDRQIGLASMHDGLSNTQASNFYTAVQAFQTTLSRNV